MLNSKRFRTSDSEQGELLPAFLGDLVPEAHPVRVFSEVIDKLNLSLLYAKYSSEGGKAYSPKVLLKIIFYGYSDHTFSSRRIAKNCIENLIYKYLCGGNSPNFRTISDFRKNNLDILPDIFKQIVELCYHLGMIKIVHISLDGTKIKANVSERKSYSKDDLKKALKQVEDKIVKILSDAERIDQDEDEAFGKDKVGNELPEELRKEKQRKQKLETLLKVQEEAQIKKINATDLDARAMKNHGRIFTSYNAQCVTENQIILANDLTNEETDHDQLIPMVEQVKAIVKELKPDKEEPLKDVGISTDTGYNSGNNLKYTATEKMDAYIPDEKIHRRAKERRGEIELKPYSKDKFTYIPEQDIYQCPEGQQLIPISRTSTKKKTYVRKEVVYKGTACQQCLDQRLCTKRKSGYRQIKRFPDYDPYREKINKKLESNSGRQAMKIRSTDVEPVFGQIKQRLSPNNRFLLRTKKKVKGEFNLWCITHNLKKIVKQIISEDLLLEPINCVNWS